MNKIVYDEMVIKLIILLSESVTMKLGAQYENHILDYYLDNCKN